MIQGKASCTQRSGELTREALEPLVGLLELAGVGAPDLLLGGRVDVVLEEVTLGAVEDDLRAHLHRRALA